LAVLRAVLYASVFDFPLTAEELRRTLSRQSASVRDLRQLIRRSAFLGRRVCQIGGWFVPAGRADLVLRRRQRDASSRALLTDNRRTLEAICALPFTRLVAISGSLAHLNADRDADIDLFVITRGSRVWMVTLMLVLLTKVLRRRRIVCANFVMADSHMVLDQRDLYTASQVLHLRPLVGTPLHEEFQRANPFVRQWFPNAESQPPGDWPLPSPVRWPWLKPALEAALWLPSGAIEAACRRVYGWYLKRATASCRSPEQVRLERSRLKLHTNSHRRAVLDRYERLVAEALATPAARPRSDACSDSS
jgi:hypothetical protein